jgi:hypothetical protein
MTGIRSSKNELDQSDTLVFRKCLNCAVKQTGIVSNISLAVGKSVPQEEELWQSITSLHICLEELSVSIT